MTHPPTQVPGQPAGTSYAKSIIRTWVPITVGAVVAWIVTHWNIVVSPGASATAGVVATAVVTALYYGAARAVEQRWPDIGKWLIAFNIIDEVPVYVPEPDPTPVAHDDDGNQIL